MHVGDDDCSGKRLHQPVNFGRVFQTGTYMPDKDCRLGQSIVLNGLLWQARHKSQHVTIRCQLKLRQENFLDIDQEHTFKRHKAHNEFHNLGEC